MISFKVKNCIIVYMFCFYIDQKIHQYFNLLVTECPLTIISPYSPHQIVDPRIGSELTYLALARYQLVAHPNNPSRLGNIFSLMHDIENIVSHSLVISLFFNNDAYGVVSFINNIIVPYHNAESNKSFIDKSLVIDDKI